jgi:UDP-3-O-acyl N-acetylglucosamine deacetylase
VEFTGVGIHTGQAGRARVLPAPEDSGLTFRVGDVTIPAIADHVISTRRCTVLGRDEAKISTVEHLLAALYGLGIDNARIEVEGPEIPILDGSAGPFVERFLAVGIREQAAPARRLRLAAPIWLSAEGAGPDSPSVLGLPADDLLLTAGIDFPNPGATRQVFHCRLQIADCRLEDISSDLRSAICNLQFPTDLAPARTFCFEDEVAALLAAGLGGGGSLENTVVVSAAGTSTPLRYPDELARHKALDLLGDLALVGARLAAHVIALRAGHTLHVAMADAIRKAAVGEALL